MISLIPLKETHVFTSYASFTLFFGVVGTRHNRKVNDFYLRDCFLEGNYRVLSGVRSFSKIMFLPLLWLLPRTLKWPKAWTHVPAKALPGTVMRKCIHFWIRGFSEVSIFRVLVNHSNKCVQKKLMSCKIVNFSRYLSTVDRDGRQRSTRPPGGSLLERKNTAFSKCFTLARNLHFEFPPGGSLLTEKKHCVF